MFYSRIAKSLAAVTSAYNQCRTVGVRSATLNKGIIDINRGRYMSDKAKHSKESKEFEHRFEKWKDSIIGSDEEIKKALKILNREPENAEEVQKIIGKERNKAMQKMADDPNRSYW